MTMKTDIRKQKKIEREFNREMLRSSIVSVFLTALKEKKDRDSYSFADLARDMKTSKSVVSRWFYGTPNWTLNTVSDLCEVLGLELEVKAKDRSTGEIYTDHGLEKQTQDVGNRYNASYRRMAVNRRASLQKVTTFHEDRVA